MLKRWLVMAGVAGLVLSGGLNRVQAQDDQLIFELTEDENIAAIEVELEEDQEVVLAAASLDGEVDTLVFIVNEDEDVVAENDDHETDLDELSESDSAVIYEVEEDGTYFLAVTSSSGEDEGEVLLVVLIDGEPLELEGSSNNDDDEDEDEDENEDDEDEDENEDDEDDSDASGDLGEPVVLELSEDEPFGSLTVEFEEGQEVTIIATSPDGDVDTYIGLFDEDEELLVENDDHDTNIDDLNTLDSVIEFEIEEDGEYIIFVTTYSYVVSETAAEGEVEVYVLVDGEPLELE